jgi:hypothetical protein
VDIAVRFSLSGKKSKEAEKKDTKKEIIPGRPAYGRDKTQAIVQPMHTLTNPQQNK